MTDNELLTPRNESSGNASPEQFRSGQQKALYEALSAKDRRLGDMYMGSLIARGHDANPDKFAQAAHSLRELIEKLPRYLNLPIQKNIMNSEEQIQNLTVCWGSAKSSLEGGVITEPLRKYLLSMDKFFTNYQERHPKRREQLAQVIRSLDPMPSNLPNEIERLRVAGLDECHKFFLGVSHHSPKYTEIEFDDRLDQLERILLDLLQPRTFEDHDILDQIIAEGESSD